MADIMFVVRTNPTDGRHQEFNDWYTNRHIVDVVPIDGFIAAQRFTITDEAQRTAQRYGYLAFYETDDLAAAIASLKDAIGTPKMPVSETLGPDRASCYYEAVDGKPGTVGGKARKSVYLEFLNPAGDNTDFAAAYVAQTLPAIGALPGFAGGRLLRAHADTPAAPVHRFVAIYELADQALAIQFLASAKIAGPARSADSEAFFFTAVCDRLAKQEAIRLLAA